MCKCCHQDPCVFTLVCEECECFCPYTQLVDRVAQCCVCRPDMTSEEKLHLIAEYEIKDEYCREHCKAKDYIN
jgi:hypothetical protein